VSHFVCLCAKVGLSILARKPDPKRRQLLLHEAARSPNRLAANEYTLISECNSIIIGMIHQREDDETNQNILIYDFETKKKNIFTDVQLGGEMGIISRPRRWLVNI
jgi:hypothetical protein